MQFSAEVWVTQQLEESTTSIRYLRKLLEANESEEVEQKRLRSALSDLNGRENSAGVFNEDLQNIEKRIQDLSQQTEQVQNETGEMSRRIEALQVLKDSMDKQKGK